MTDSKIFLDTAPFIYTLRNGRRMGRLVLTVKSKLAVQQSIDTLQTLKAKLMQEYFG